MNPTNPTAQTKSTKETVTPPSNPTGAGETQPPIPPSNPAGATPPPPPPPNPPTPTPSVKVYFSKALLTNQIVVGGKPPGWEPLDGNQGVIMLDSVGDSAMIAGLEEFIAKQSGGVLKISAQEYEDLKKNRPWKQPAAKSWLNEPLKIAGRKKFQPVEPKPSVSPRAAALAGANGAPVEAPGSDVPQRPPDQPDFKTSGAFAPATARLPASDNVEKK